MAEKKQSNAKIIELASVVPLLDDGNGNMIDDKFAASVLGFPNLGAAAPTPAEVEATTRTALAWPKGLATRRRNDGAVELMIELQDGLERLERVFPRHLSPEQHRLATNSSCPQMELDCAELPYCPVRGMISPSGQVMLLIEAHGSAAAALPKVSFLGKAPADVQVRKSPRGESYSTLHFTCDPDSEIIFDCPTDDQIMIEVRGSLFSD